MTINNFKNNLLNVLFPQTCLVCKRLGEIICSDCLSLVDITPFQYCPYCSHPQRVINEMNCEKHRKEKLNGLFFACDYRDAICQKMIRQFKYSPYLKNLSKPLANLIISHFLLSEKQVISQPGENSILIASPLEKGKQKQRGFNQATLIAHELSNYFKIPLEKNNLIKIKRTASQTTLNKEQRKQNIAGAFALRSPEKIANKTIFIVDDVYTTGSTMQEIAKLLKKYKANKVYGITIARESLNH